MAFPEEILPLKEKRGIPLMSKLFCFHSVLDSYSLMRVAGSLGQAKLSYWKQHPVLLPANHELTNLIICSQHLWLLHAGPTLVVASLSHRFCIMRAWTMIQSIVHNCVICWCVASEPRPQIIGLLLPDSLSPGWIFDHYGVDYTGLIMIKSGSIRKPTITKCYIAVCVCFSVKGVHLE